MGTEMMRSQDCLARPSPAFGSARPLRRRMDPSPKQQPAMPCSPAGGGGGRGRIVLGQVKILRRGESLEAAKARTGEAAAAAAGGVGSDQAVFGAGRLGPDPAMIPKELRLRLAVAPPLPLPLPDVYAGSGFVLSPSPRALPLPSFFSRREETPAVDCSATMDLRRLLRLE